MKQKNRRKAVFNKKDRKPISVKWKIFVTLVFFIVIIIAVLWFFQVFFLEKFYMFIKSNSVKNAASEVNEVITQKLDGTLDTETYKTKISNIAHNGDFCVIVYDEDTTKDPIMGNESDGKCMLSKSTSYAAHVDVITELKKEALSQKDGIASKLIEDTSKVEVPFESFRFSLTKEGLMIPRPEAFPTRITSDIKDGGRNKESMKISKGVQNMTYISVVRGSNSHMKISVINAQLTPVNATIDTIKTQFIIIAAILTVVALLLAFYLSRKIARPIISINDGAKTLATGQYDVAFSGKGYLEIEELSNTLNYASKELSKVENLRRELIANMSHDLRTPLTMISGYGEVMRDIPGENTPENVQIIIDETKRLTNLVNDMLDLSKLQAGVQELNVVSLNLTDEIRSIIERYETLLKQNEYDIRFEYTRDVLVQGDVIKLDQVIYNLINNAINYSGEDHQVIVRQLLDHDRVRIEIVDHGPGIEKDKLPYIWERYYKVDKTHVRSKVGSGLGLSIVKAVLELHQAEYGVHSEEGKGSIFWFSLPYTQSEKQESEKNQLPKRQL